MKMKAVLVRWLAVCLIVCSTAGAQTTIMNDHFNNSSNTNNATGWQVQVSGASVTTPSNGLSTNSYLSSSLVSYQTIPRIPIYPDYGALLLTLGQGRRKSAALAHSSAQLTLCLRERRASR